MKEINCNLCGQNNAKLLFQSIDRRINTKNKTIFSIVQCENCGLIYVNPQPSYEELKEFYGENYFDFQNSNISKGSRIFKFLQLIKNKILGSSTLPNSKFYRYKNKIFQQTSGEFLDVGCATGVQNIPLMKEFSQWKFYGLEPDEVAFREASKIKGFNIKNGFLENVNYPDNFFDVILINQVLEHLFDPKNTLLECKRILKDDGKLIIAVPNYNSLSSKFFGKFWYHLDIPRHLYHFNYQTLMRLAKESGFRIEIIKKEVLAGTLKSIFILFNIKPDKFDNNILFLIFKNVTGCIGKIFNPILEKLKLASGLYIVLSR